MNVLSLNFVVVSAVEVIISYFIFLGEDITYFVLDCIDFFGNFVTFGFGVLLTFFDDFHLLSQSFNFCIFFGYYFLDFFELSVALVFLCLQFLNLRFNLSKLFSVGQGSF